MTGTWEWLAGVVGIAAMLGVVFGVGVALLERPRTWSKRPDRIAKPDRLSLRRVL